MRAYFDGKCKSCDHAATHRSMMLYLILLLLILSLIPIQSIGQIPRENLISTIDSNLRSDIFDDQFMAAINLPVPVLDPIEVPYYWAMNAAIQFGLSPKFMIPFFLNSSVVQVTDSRSQFQGYLIDFGIRIHGDAVAEAPEFGAIGKVVFQTHMISESVVVDNILVVKDNGDVASVKGSGYINTKRVTGGIDLTMFHNLYNASMDNTYMEMGISMERELIRNQDWRINVPISNRDSVVEISGYSYNRECMCFGSSSDAYSKNIGVGVIFGLFHQHHLNTDWGSMDLISFLRFKHGIVNLYGAAEVERSVSIGIGFIVEMGIYGSSDYETDAN